MKQKGVVIKWRELGLQLLSKEYVRCLDIIRADHPQNSNDCCTEMLELWLKITPDANWNQLCKALNVIDLPVAAEGLIHEICRGTYPFVLNVYIHTYIYMYIYNIIIYIYIYTYI